MVPDCGGLATLRAVLLSNVDLPRWRHGAWMWPAQRLPPLARRRLSRRQVLAVRRFAPEQHFAGRTSHAGDLKSKRRVRPVGRKISTLPHPSPESGVNLVVLTMAADIPHDRNSAEFMAQYAEELTGNGERAEALDWFARILEGGEPELAPHAALRIGQVVIDDDLTAALAALRYAADHAGTQVAACARQNLEAIERHGAGTRPEPVPVQEVLGRAALARGRLWCQAGEIQAAVDSFQDAAGCPVPDVAVPALSYLGECLLTQGDDEAAAVDALERARAAGHPRYSPLAAITLAGYLAEHDSVSRAVDLLRWAQSVGGDTAALAAVSLGVTTARRLGDVPGGVAQLRQAAECGLPLIEANALFELAVILEDNGDASGAQEAYQRAIELRQPQYSGKAAVNLGILLSRRMDLKGAQAALRSAVGAGDPDQAAKARSMLAEMAQLGDLDQAQDAAQRIDMNDPAVIGAAALATAQKFLERGDLASAVRAYEKAMDTGHPLYAPEGAARVGLAFSLAERDDRSSRKRRRRGADGPGNRFGEAGAQVAISRLTEVGYGHLVPRAWFCYGALMARGGQLADADAAFRRVPDSASDAHAAAMCALWILRGDAARSEPPYRHLLSTAPDLAGEIVMLALDLGAYQSRTGDHGTARGTFHLGCQLAELSGQPDLIARARQARDG